MLRARKTPIVCYVTDRKSLGASQRFLSVSERIQWAMGAGADWIQIREKDMPAHELVDLVRDAVASAAALRSVGDAGDTRANPQVIVNDRLDAALAAGAVGVHLGRESVNAREVANWCRNGNAREGFLIGVSCHSLAEARAAEAAGASYIFFGPVFETPAKRAFGKPQGVAHLTEICRCVGVPVLAIGGVDERNAQECTRAGAAGIAAIRMFQQAPDAHALESVVQQIKA